VGAPPEATTDQVADALIHLFQFSKAQARNAYSAMLLIPGFGGLRFHTLLTPYKRLWNQNLEKYGAFWDPLPILLGLAKAPMPTDICTLRTQLIFCSRILCLYRSSDLAQVKRTTSVLGRAPYIKIKRKGQKFHKWERVVSIPQCPQISPFHLMMSYVAATRLFVRPGGPLLISLKPPSGP
jgi:hypothetical protein